jgi:ADP-ribose pyrophosphatase YjhB (NUDIX family)
MITFGTGDVQFTNRVVGVAVHDGYVLLHRAERDDFWALPGGRGELLEPSEGTLVREMREELGVEIRVVRLLWVVENFFQDTRSHHELGLYYLMDLGPDYSHYDPDVPFLGEEDGLRLIFRWFPVDGLEAVRLYPTFLRTALRSLPRTTQHVVHTDVE